MQILWGVGGVLVLLAIAFLLSTNRRAINPRTVIVALLIQLAFAFAVLYWDLGRRALRLLTDGVQAIINSSNAGIEFLFGPALPGQDSGVVFAFQVLPIIIFFASLTSVLYHLKVLQWVVTILGGALQKALGTSRPESLSVTSDIFLGPTEAPLVVRPYVERMTDSELFTVMVGGLASVAGSTLVGYSLLGAPLEYLLAAAFMSAPAALLMAKIMMPETREPESRTPAAEDESVPQEEDMLHYRNVIDAAASGAADGLRLALNVGAMLIAFVSLIALANLLLGSLGGLVGFEGLSLQLILGYIFAPVALVIGVPPREILDAGNFIGQKVILNEFVAYSNFGPRVGEFSEKTVAIVSFALAGFANFGTLAILIGGVGGLAPSRRGQIAQFGIRALIAGTLANLLNAAIAGMLIG
ncbi:MAG: NupC/NupG family nucleoside CNT transporter [Actinomycetota bacterium]|nr:NupC/NupG family nucleoside CNT transporter [Actinomycetota bacterium]